MTAETKCIYVRSLIASRIVASFGMGHTISSLNISCGRILPAKRGMPAIYNMCISQVHGDAAVESCILIPVRTTVGTVEAYAASHFKCLVCQSREP